MQTEYEERAREALAKSCNMMILNLKDAIRVVEECRGRALRSCEPITPTLVELAPLCSDATKLVTALGVTLLGALEQLPAGAE